MDTRTMPAGPELDAELEREFFPETVDHGRSYSSTWMHAGIAAEEMRRRGYTILILMEPGHPITVEVARHGTLLATGYGETLPLAATRAFVLALRSEAGE